MTRAVNQKFARRKVALSQKRLGEKLVSSTTAKLQQPSDKPGLLFDEKLQGNGK